LRARRKGLRDAVTGIAGAFLQNHAVLVVGGQVKSSDLARGTLRQRGIQEIDGVALASSITVGTMLIDAPKSRREVLELIQKGEGGRPGPIFIDFCLDAQGAPIAPDRRAALEAEPASQASSTMAARETWEAQLAALMAGARRPILLLGGGVRNNALRKRLDAVERAGIPVMTTWNGCDRFPADHPLYFGRPNTWGQRYANVLMQQSDLLIAVGSRLGLQQTGFNWQQFTPVAKVVQVDLDRAELEKGHPVVDLPIQADSDTALDVILAQPQRDYSEWRAFCSEVKGLMPLVEDINHTGQGYVSPYRFCADLSRLAGDDDLVVPCSSGGANTVMQQTFAPRGRQRMMNNGALAAMGYGLSAAIGAALAHPDRRTLLVEGDGGFAQNVQELGTVAVNRLNMKIFIFDDNGYASIRMTQKNYFGGDYMGCDTSTGLGLPDWSKLFDAYGLPSIRLTTGYLQDRSFLDAFAASAPCGFIVPIDPEQTYFPKITSRVTASGTMESNPLHAMSPALPPDIAARVYRYIPSPY
jgi:acetolactate synthase I/II/III large subunit